MKFELTINTDNAAFGETAQERNAEVVRIMQYIATRLEKEPLQVIFGAVDHNGNIVGAAVFLEGDIQ